MQGIYGHWTGILENALVSSIMEVIRLIGHDRNKEKRPFYSYAHVACTVQHMYQGQLMG